MLPLTAADLEPIPDYPKERRFESNLRFTSINEAKAGWLTKIKGIWSITNAGRRALADYPDPSVFHKEAQRLYKMWSANQEPRVEAKSTGELDRTSADTARALMRLFYPDQAVREYCEERLAASIRWSDEARPGSWSVSMHDTRFRLIAGRVFVFDLVPSEVNVVVAGVGMDDKELAALGEAGAVEPWKTGLMPDFQTVTVKAEKLATAWPELEDAHRDAILRAAKTASRSPYMSAHSRGITAMLREDVGLDVAEPHGPELAPEKISTSLQVRTLAEALADWNRDSASSQVEAAELERKAIVEKYPLSDWPTMTLQQFALGQDKDGDTFCYVMEFGSPRLGSIRGGSARKLIIYKHATQPGWYFDPKYSSEETAWNAVRDAFVQAFELGEKYDFSAIEALGPLRPGPALRTKSIFTYFPDRLLPIYSSAHLEHFTRLLDGPPATLTAVAANRRLFDLIYARPEFKGWSTFEVGLFLYQWAHPRQTKRIVKIAPGRDAILWDECREGGFICVGWDKVGDLGRFGSEGEFKEEFTAQYLDEYKGSQAATSLKAGEVWTLRELEPGDLVIANKGISHVLAIGTVVEPGYVWRPERPEYKHTVSVKWDVSAETDIEPVPQWAMKTVANVSQELYGRIMHAAPAGSKSETPPSDLLEMLGHELDRRGQAILYGPPGTGKTYNARRFSVWWLRSAWKKEDAKWVLGDKDLFQDVEEELTLVPNNDPKRAAILTRVTFHPSYSYEDFIEGYKPRPTEGKGGLELELRQGAFMRVCREAAADPEGRPYLIVIDEVNRGNIPKIFGELITLLEKDKRAFQVLLPQSGERFGVPSNVFMIGTMNTADRSIRLLDAALRRRFSFIELMPNADLLSGGSVEGRLSLDLFLRQLNERIAKEVGREKQIGHSYFLDDQGAPVTTAEAFAPRFLREVVPLIQEYAYDDFDIFTEILGPGLVDAVRQRLKQEVLDDPQALVEALAAEFKSGEVDADES
ncbi:MAG TPA: AAA family ATPase [Candidatus Dormibacteraeota bacterium]|nr:AAA family ATPase [Candidatus Dormibacteraeota bacterium]